MLKKLIFPLMFSLSGLICAQDLITMRSGDKLNCKITKVDSLCLYYRILTNNRTLNSFVEKNEVRSYQYNIAATNNKDEHLDSLSNNKNENLVILDTTLYVKKETKWISLATFSQRFGIHANGWAIQYYGCVLDNSKKWIFPIIAGIEKFDINQEYFNQFNYQSARLSYYMAGISPLRKLNDHFYANLGCQLLIGSEEVIDFNYYRHINMVFGIAPFQGIMFIPKSNFGITFGIGVYEKLLTSMFYRNDLGLKFEIGLKL